MTSSVGSCSSFKYTVIVPVYNGRRTIGQCLDALARQVVAPDYYEIVVVDDGSKDETPTIVASWIAEHPHHHARLVQQTNCGPAGARNHGARVVSSPILLFTDADCVPTETWIAELTAPFADPSIVGAKGAYLTDQKELPARFVQAEYEDRYARMAGQTQIDFIDTYSAAYRRDVFLENGGFDTIFTTASVEDQEFSFRLAQKGYRMVFAPKARVYHIHDTDWREYARRKYYIGYWKALLTRWHPERMVHDSHTPQVLKMQIVLVAGMLASAALGLLGIFWPALTWSWALTALLSGLFVVSAIPFLLSLFDRSAPLAIVGIWMLIVRAVALGSGYLLGTIHFAGTLPGARQPVIPTWKRLVKRALDITGALIRLALSIPLIATAAVAIKLDSPGPIFFWQVRVGENGHLFRIVKLRSMVVGAEHQLPSLIDVEHLAEEPAFKIANDPRVTRVGRSCDAPVLTNCRSSIMC